MTSRERLLCALRGGQPDCVPVAPFTMGHIDLDSPLGRELVAATDPLIDVWSGAFPFLGSAAEVRHVEDGDTTTNVYETPKGPLTQRVRRTEITSATVEYALKTPADVERFLSIPYAAPDLDLSHYEKLRTRIGEDGLVLAALGNAVCLPAEWFSPEDFCLCWAEAPETMVRLCEVASERLNAYVERLCRAGVDAFRIVGGEYVSVQLGPKAFARLVTPFDTSLVAVMHRHGAIAYYHNHGRVTKYLPALAALGIDGLDPLEAPPWGDVDLAEARKIAGDRLCFVGNLDDMEIIDRLPEDEVLRIARERLDAAGSRAFILGGTASGTYGERGARNFIAMAEMVHRL